MDSGLLYSSIVCSLCAASSGKQQQAVALLSGCEAIFRRRGICFVMRCLPCCLEIHKEGRVARVTLVLDLTKQGHQTLFACAVHVICQVRHEPKLATRNANLRSVIESAAQALRRIVPSQDTSALLVRLSKGFDCHSDIMEAVCYSWL